MLINAVGCAARIPPQAGVSQHGQLRIQGLRHEAGGGARARHESGTTAPPSPPNALAVRSSGLRGGQASTAAPCSWPCRHDLALRTPSLFPRRTLPGALPACGRASPNTGLAGTRARRPRVQQRRRAPHLLHLLQGRQRRGGLLAQPHHARAVGLVGRKATPRALLGDPHVHLQGGVGQDGRHLLTHRAGSRTVPNVGFEGLKGCGNRLSSCPGQSA